MTELAQQLAGLAWTASGAMLAVLMLRRPVRRWSGATLAYQGWLIVPAAMLATFVPIVRPYQRVLATPVLHLATYTGPVLATGSGGVEWANWALLAWAAGAVVAGIRFWRQHVLFMASLGSLSVRGGAFYSSSNAGGPALVGLWRPKVVVPADFAERYTAGEQALILAHERMHVRRGDPLANSVAALLQCVFWFNPIVHFAVNRFRFDQELACDAAVMREHPRQRRCYAHAMLKTQTDFTATPSTITCHWQSSHQLKERLMTLHQSQPRAARRLTGRLLVAALVCASGYSALSARADTAPRAGAKTYDVSMTFTTPAGKSAPRVLARGGEPFKVAMSDKGVKMMASFVVTPVDIKNVRLEGTVECGNGTPAHPVLITRLGMSATVKVQEAGAPGCELDIVVSEATMAAPAK
ncbi:MAG: energy transducer TonB [Massilia sp.]|nr:energy transducer TonB [Massilia sp.]